MRSHYRRKIKIQLLTAEQQNEAHGWANVRLPSGEEQRHYFKADQPRFMMSLNRVGVSAPRRQLEKWGIHPESITIRQGEHSTFTYKQLFADAEHHHQELELEPH